MERPAATSPSSTNPSAFVRWEEVFVSSDRGRREVHYYLKRKDGSSDLAVIGKEKSLRHMSYHYAIRNRSLISIAPSFSLVKLRSRREVIDWLNSLVQDLSLPKTPQPTGPSQNNKDAYIDSLKDIQLHRLGHFTKEFLWLGSPWTCRKRRNHYQSFRRNGIKISVHDFVYVLAEEDKRLVAYLEDMYEDSRGNRMVVVRWFHKIDEVGIVLPLNFNDREIFFSLCHQDLSIECIDGLATVLGPQHFEKFLNEATHTQLEPFVCHKQFDNDEVKPFDITQVKGYWKQEILRYMYTSTLMPDVRSQSSDDVGVEGNLNDASGSRPNKRHCRSEDADACLQLTNKEESVDTYRANFQNISNSLIDYRNEPETCALKDGSAVPFIHRKEAIKQKLPQFLAIGSQVEVLSQDSGIRGCWLRALIIKKHRCKVKVRYQDIMDAADETSNLEEWILASRVAVPDESGLRICGRTTIRPPPPGSNKGRVSWAFDVGSVVDAWWHDGWWEGIVVQKESEDRIHVYFPGEKQELVFGRSDLRHSEEWYENSWKHMKERPDLVTSILSGRESKHVVSKSSAGKLAQTAICDIGWSKKDEGGCVNSQLDSGNDKLKGLGFVPDLLKDDTLSQLKWKTSRKRRRVSGGSVQKLHVNVNTSKSASEIMGSHACDRFFIPKSLKVDCENCKYVRDSLFSSSVVPPLTNLVMSR